MKTQQIINGVTVQGADVDAQTRCAHYHGERDIIAIKFKCCGKYYPCYQCHAECASHSAKVWAISEFDTKAILCGACGHQLTVSEYFECSSKCPRCESDFNPNCALHYSLYFEKADVALLK